MEADQIYFTCDFLDNFFFSQSIDFKYTKIRHYQKKMRKNYIAEEKYSSPISFP